MGRSRFSSAAALHAALAALVGCVPACGGATREGGVAGDGGGGTGPVAHGGEAVGGQPSAGAKNGGSGGTPTPTGGVGGSSSGGAGAGGTAVGGYGGAAGGTSPGTPAMVVCDMGAPSLIEGLSPAMPVDFFALYRSTVSDPSQAPTRTVVAQSGTECSGAQSASACHEALAAAVSALPNDAGWGSLAPIVSLSFFVATRGDDVLTISNDAELKAFLGPIDTANEAAIVLWSRSLGVTCEGLMEDDAGYFAASQRMLSDCPITYQPLEVHVAHDGTVSERNTGEPTQTGACVGRRPDGLAAAGAARGSSELGRYFAELARLELAAVVAFELLARDLARLGAPASLIQRCLSARGDEVRHHLIMAQLAARYGGAPEPVQVGSRGERSFLALALENAGEGEVRELYGAACAEWQARRASDPEVRRQLERVARDEASHAWLSFELGAWLDVKLSVEERALVEQERERARAGLELELRCERSADLHEVAGVPRPAEALRLLELVAELTEPRRAAAPPVAEGCAAGVS